jgi:hypothetical protein
MTEQMPGELIYEYTIQSTGATSYGVPAQALCCPVSQTSSARGLAPSDSDPARLLTSPPPRASDGGVIGDGDLRADRGTNRLARQAMLGEQAGHRRSNPSI